jgi:hypothetical protein
MAYKRIEDFKNIHEGEEVFLLGNAANLLDHKELLEEVPYKIGINSSNAHIKADYHVLVDSAAGFRHVKHPHVPKYLFYAPGAIQCTTPEGCVHVPFQPRCNSYVAWSEDASKFIQVCKSTMWVALQLARFMGFKYAYLMGFELGGPRISGHTHADTDFLDENAAGQLQLMGYLRGLIEGNKWDFFPFVTSMTTKCKAFPHIRIEHRDIQRDFLYNTKPIDIQVTWDE